MSLSPYQPFVVVLIFKSKQSSFGLSFESCNFADVMLNQQHYTLTTLPVFPNPVPGGTPTLCVNTCSVGVPPKTGLGNTVLYHPFNE